MIRPTFNALQFVLVGILLSPAFAPSAMAQLPQGAVEFNKDVDFVGSYSPQMFQVFDKTATWMIRVGPQSTVRVSGTAEPSFLQPKLSVKFTGELDKKGVLQAPISELEIFTPMGKSGQGIYAPGSDEKSKPVAKLEAGSYEIRGRVGSFRDEELTVIAGGKKVTGKVAPDAKITVNVADVSFAQKDDVVKVVGYYYEKFRPDANAGRPGQADATSVEITIAKPLVGMQKKGPPGKTPRGKGKPEGESPANPDDPFGLGAPKAGDKPEADKAKKAE